MTCKRPGCGKPTGTDRDGRARKYCSQTCSTLRNRPVIRVAVDDADYQMACLHCGTKYDGRRGPWVGLCSNSCLAAHVVDAAERA